MNWKLRNKTFQLLKVGSTQQNEIFRVLKVGTERKLINWLLQVKVETKDCS